jgi:Reverse transcriptase (RNA-dependent DNA polymerase)
MSTWDFKCKRYPDGGIHYLQACFCAHDDRQIEGFDFFDTFAPIINWTTVCMMLILFIILGLSTCQVDCTAAFVNAPIDRDLNWDSFPYDKKKQCGIYLDIPRGFSQSRKVLKLNRSLYGLCQSHLQSRVEAIGFESQEKN